MAAARVVVYPPSETGGRQVRVDGQILGTAYSLPDLAAFLARAGIDDTDAVYVGAPQRVEWRGGGSDVWEH
ncbi:hypothetical protein [Streptomyces carpinensis]|uniref:Uncharacterized protein n=1 Tax=Streptomyces carpinensis TaxID=66369 RepID=A0ABV1W3E8_9ACTN|nr:hypothetical protein [Streptomyces carpinensis]